MRSDDGALLLGRILIGALFVPSGFAKLVGFSAFAASLTSKGLPFPEAWAALAVVTELGGGLLIVVGAEIRFVALLMIAFTFVAAMLSHRYWAMSDEAMRRANSIQFWKNIAIMGGFLVLHASGAGKFSVDAWLERRGLRSSAVPPA